MNVVIGTAGHIDHGKTALVKALTGIDADRLPEEKQRGITIDIGFAELDLGDVRAAFVDVPGHERFVKNMLAGASGIDIVMLVVAADEGVMPQTREHFNICRLLGLERGIVAITKADLADSETLALAKLEIDELVAGTFLETARVVVTSAATRTGLDELKDAIRESASSVERGVITSHAFVPIDRSFSVKGHGAVVTGTLQHGQITIGSSVELLPEGRQVRIRGIQTHGRAAERGTAGNRVAVNLGGVDSSSITRGMVLADKGVFATTQVLDARIELLANAPRPLRPRQRVRVHIGTAEILARLSILDESGEIAPGTTGFAQLRLETPTTAVYGTPVIIRSYSPQETIGGGRVLDPLATRHRRRDAEKVRSFLSSIADASGSHSDLLLAFITRSESNGLSTRGLTSRTGWLPELITEATRGLIDDSKVIEAGGRFFSAGSFEKARRELVAAVKQHHEKDPLSTGAPKELLRRGTPVEVFSAIVDSLIASGTLTVSGDLVALAKRKQELSPAEAAARTAISNALESSQLEVPKIADLLDETGRSTGLTAGHVRRILQMLLDNREVVKVSDEFYFSRRAVDSLIAKLREKAPADRVIDVAKFKEISGLSRKYAIPLLEYFDNEKITIRSGEKRLVR